jgi:hypothetical protein
MVLTCSLLRLLVGVVAGLCLYGLHQARMHIYFSISRWLLLIVHALEVLYFALLANGLVCKLLDGMCIQRLLLAGVSSLPLA